MAITLIRLSSPLFIFLYFLICLPSSVSAEIIINGIIDEIEWNDAQVFDQFVTVEPLSGAPAKYKTQVRLLTNAEGIYVAFSNYQPASVKRVNRRFARDVEIKGDRNIVSIDFDGNQLTGYDFTVGSANSMQDGILANDKYRRDWDGIWYSETSSDENYWYSEIFIPWSVAPMTKTESGKKEMSFWFSRVVYDESLRFAFPDAFYTRNTFIQDWHRIEVNQEETSSFEMYPYLSYTNNIQSSQPNIQTSDAKAGLDFIWRPNSSVQLTGALSPDFGQVESDDLVVNFSAFETFMSEKRPFFTENQGLFNSEIPNEDVILYTRRIGSGYGAKEGTPIDIDYATKFTRYSDSFDLGVFYVKEDDLPDFEGSEYLSSRLQRKQGDLTLGHRLTYVNRNEIGKEATVQVIDSEWKMSETTLWQLHFMHSKINQNSDLEQYKSNDIAAWVSWNYQPSDERWYTLYYSHYGEDFDLTDLGYMKRRDYNEWYAYFQNNWNENLRLENLLSAYWSLEAGESRTNAGNRLELWWNSEAELTFKNTGKVKLRLGTTAPGWDNLLTRGFSDFRKPVQKWSELSYSGPQGGDFSYYLSTTFETDGLEDLNRSVNFGIGFYASETLNIGSSITYKEYREWLIWDSEIERLTNYKADSYFLDLRLDWNPSSNHEIRFKFQWAGVDAVLSEVFEISHDGYLNNIGLMASNFSFGDTALQLRYRYKLGPLSDAYLVYSRGGYFDSYDGEEGVNQLFNNGWDNVSVESIIAKIRLSF